MLIMTTEATPRLGKPRCTSEMRHATANPLAGAAGRRATIRTGAPKERRHSVKSAEIKGTMKKHVKARPERHHHKIVRM